MIFTFIPEPKDAQDAAFQARIMDRAVTLFQDGYAVVWGAQFAPEDPAMQAKAAVVSPEGKTYLVDMFAETCACECCQKHKFCKHLIAVLMADDAACEAAQLEALERYEANR